jgi:hypothetical protein
MNQVRIKGVYMKGLADEEGQEKIHNRCKEVLEEIESM